MLKYDHDYVSKSALKRLLEWKYADADGRTAGSFFREDLGTAFHWPATPQGPAYWAGVGDTNPKTETLSDEDRTYLQALFDSEKTLDAI